MKLTAIILFSACIAASAKGFSQKVNLSEKNAPLEKVFKAIEKQTGFSFYYKVELLEKAKPVDLTLKDATLEEALQALFKDQPLTYNIVSSNIVVKEKNPVTITGGEMNLPPPIDVHGRIVNEKGEPVAGASVQVEKTNHGTTTDAGGDFILKGVDENTVLRISGTNIETFEIKILVSEKQREAGFIDLGILTAKIKVTESEGITINAGYYKTTDRLKTGDITKVNGEDIQKQPVSNPLGALQGKVPGLEITQASGVPGGNFKVRIRGTNSIANGNNPLFVIDGVPYVSTPMSFNETSAGILGNSLSSEGLGGSSPLNNINPADIESIEVLKDADATAIYGSRGSNGVVLITTKKGKAGKTKVDFNLYSGIGKVARKMDLLNTAQYLQMRHEAFTNDNVVPTTANAKDLLIWDTTRYTDWQKELLGGTANYSDAQVSFSGGDQYTQFLFGGGYHKETTVFPGDNNAQKISAHVSLTNSTPDGKLKSQVSANYLVNNTDLLSQDLTTKALSLAPIAPALYNSDGSLNWTGWDNSGALENPVAYLNRRYEAITNALIANANIEYSILKNLSLKANLGYSNTQMDAYNLTPISSLNPAVASTSQNTTNFSTGKFQNWVVEPQASWKSKIFKGQLSILIGSQFMNQVSQGGVQTATGFSSEALMKNLSAAPTRSFSSNSYAQYKYASAFGRANYNYDNKYIINLTGRRDGSSRFGPGKQFGNFGAAGLAWIFSNENFIQKSLPFLSYGKLRLSYGTVGNDQLTDYQYLDAYTSSSGPYQGVIGLTPSRLSNPEFSWEINKKLEAGLELGFVNDRILASFSYYKNRSSSQLVGEPLPPTTGFTSIQANLPATVQNSGIEIEINTRNIETKSFTWKTSFNISVPRNKLVAFPNLSASATYSNMYVIGEPLNIRMLYHYTGINPTTGLYQFQDINNDGVINSDDRHTLRFVGTNYAGGIVNSLSYGGFQLDFLFQFVKQTGRSYAYYFSTPPGYPGNQPAFVLNRWQKSGDDNSRQRFGQNSAIANPFSLLASSDASVVDASFIRLKNVSLGWSVPPKWIKKIHAENASLFVHGQNLLTITKYEGLDPETLATFLPPLRVWAFGINITF